MKKNLSLLLLLFLIATLLGGCVDYAPPPKIVHADNYTATLNSEKRVLPEYNGLFTVDDAIRIGLANNPDYESQRLSVTLAYNSYYQAMVSYLPSLNVSTSMDVGGGQTQTPAFGSAGWQKSAWSHGASATASSSLVIFNGLRREFNLLAQAANVKMTEEQQKDMRRILIYSIIIAYYDIAQTK